MLEPADFSLTGAGGAQEGQAPTPLASESSRLDAVERHAIARALEAHGRNISRAAESLGLTRASLYRRMQKYGL
ncbi:MAG: helix-turn-helix domain-containing protein [Steroidobacteraceae bacterium]